MMGNVSKANLMKMENLSGLDILVQMILVVVSSVLKEIFGNSYLIAMFSPLRKQILVNTKSYQNLL